MKTFCPEPLGRIFNFQREPSLAKEVLELPYAGKKKISITGKSIVFFWGKIKKSLMQSFRRLQNEFRDFKQKSMHRAFSKLKVGYGAFGT